MAASDGDAYKGTTFAIENEDHTLANSLRFFLNKRCALGGGATLDTRARLRDRE
jgi:hypothetical protein